jgi:hypothetical protein
MSRSWPWPCTLAKGARAARVAPIVRLLALVACAHGRRGQAPAPASEAAPGQPPARKAASGLRLGPAAQPKVAPVAHPHIAAAQHEHSHIPYSFASRGRTSGLSAHAERHLRGFASHAALMALLLAEK